MPDDDPALAFRKAEARIRSTLFGDGLYEPGVLKGEESRGKVTRELRHMREAFDAALREMDDAPLRQATERIADLENELRRMTAELRATASAAQAPRTLRQRKAS